jgi:hypothetical protein
MMFQPIHRGGNTVAATTVVVTTVVATTATVKNKKHDKAPSYSPMDWRTVPCDEAAGAVPAVIGTFSGLRHRSGRSSEAGTRPFVARWIASARLDEILPFSFALEIAGCVTPQAAASLTSLPTIATALLTASLTCRKSSAAGFVFIAPATMKPH